MERIVRCCEEVQAFACKAERTGAILELRSLRSGRRTCTSVRDLIRKYRLYGDGYFYLAVGQWPVGRPEVDLDNVKWIGAAGLFPPAEKRRLRRTAELPAAVA